MLKRKFSPKVKTLGRVALLTCTGLVSTVTAFCADSGSALQPVTEKLTTLADKFTGDVLPLVTAVGGVALIIAFASAMIAKDSKVSQTAWAWVKRIIITLICIWAVGGILKIVELVGTNVNDSVPGAKQMNPNSK